MQKRKSIWLKGISTPFPTYCWCQDCLLSTFMTILAAANVSTQAKKFFFYSAESDKEVEFVEKPGGLPCSQNSCLTLDYLPVGASGGGLTLGQHFWYLQQCQVHSVLWLLHRCIHMLWKQHFTLHCSTYSVYTIRPALTVFRVLLRTLWHSCCMMGFVGCLY